MKEINSYTSVLVIVLGFCILSLIFNIYWLNILGLSIGVIAVLSSKIANLISVFWYKLAEILGKINGTILLTIIFILLVTTLSFFRNLFSSKKVKALNSSFEVKNHKYTKKDFENPW